MTKEWLLSDLTQTRLQTKLGVLEVVIQTWEFIFLSAIS
jgi:hypothetical protein